MTESLSKIPSGISYYFGREATLRRRIEQVVMSVFDGWSYEEITTPTVDYYSLFERGMGSTEAQRAFRFTDSDGRLLALRRDVTSGIARAASTLMAKRERPLRFCYAAPVFHMRSSSHTEWRRESTQIGCELIGRNSTVADLEVVTIASEILDSLGLSGRYTITFNDLEIFNGIAESLGLDAESREQMRQLVDMHNATDLKRFLASYASANECEAFAQLVQLSGKGEVFDKARSVMVNGRSMAALDRLQALWRIIEELERSDRFEIDLADVTKLDYYTGLVFKIYVVGAGSRVGSGGRYDQLTANFGNPEPAVGFVLDLDALAGILNPENLLDEPPAKAAYSIEHDEPLKLFREALARRAQAERVVIKPTEVTT